MSTNLIEVSLLDTERDHLEYMAEYIKSPIFIEHYLNDYKVQHLVEVIESLIICRTPIDKT